MANGGGEAITGPLHRHRPGANALVCPYTLRFAPDLFLALTPFSPLPSIATRQGSAVPNYADLALRSRIAQQTTLRIRLGPCRHSFI